MPSTQSSDSLGRLHWIPLTYSWIVHRPRRLNLDDALREADAADANAQGCGVEAFEDVGLDTGHELPVRGIGGIVGTMGCYQFTP